MQYRTPRRGLVGAEVGGQTLAEAGSREEEADSQQGPPRASGKGSRQLLALLARIQTTVKSQLHTLMDAAQAWIIEKERLALESIPCVFYFLAVFLLS